MRIVFRIKIQGKEQDFVWGPVVKVHEIGQYSIVEYRPSIFKNCTSTGEYEKQITNFHPYIESEDTNRSYESLDEAILGVLAYRWDGSNSQAGYLIARMLGIKEGRN